MPLTHELCEQAALEAFNDKWFRRNYLAMAEKYGGVTRAELQTAARVADMGPRLEVVHGIALEREQRIDDLLDGVATEHLSVPVHTFPRIDGISMKLRQLSDCCPAASMFRASGLSWPAATAARKTVAVSVRQHPEERPDGTKAAS